MEKKLEDLTIESFSIKSAVLDEKEKKILTDELNQQYSIKRD
ncbi:hypothetical protein RJG79_06825 [Mycoplasmatota bacterium WC44]